MLVSYITCLCGILCLVNGETEIYCRNNLNGQQMSTGASSNLTGYVAAWCVVFIWSFWLIVSRVANDSGLTIYDLAALRYGLASLIAVPLCIYYQPWRDLNIFQISVLSFVLGPVYILFVFSGFLYAPAAHGGVFMNGVLPIISILFMIIFMRVLPSARQVFGGILIFVSAIFLAFNASVTSDPNAWIGDVLFLTGALFFSAFIILTERWQLDAMQIIFCGTIVNAALYLPVWAIWLPSNITEAPIGSFMLQAIYQGFVPNFIGLLFVAHASRTIGNGNTSFILAAVPGGGALLGVIILNEQLHLSSILALIILTLGLLLSVRRRPF